jgi:hypothetical protein
MAKRNQKIYFYCHFYQIRPKKNAEFYADFKFVEKVLKNAPKKCYEQNEIEENEKSGKSAYFRQVLQITYFVHFFKNFFNGFEISMKFWVFRYLL